MSADFAKVASPSDLAGDLVDGRQSSRLNNMTNRVLTRYFSRGTNCKIAVARMIRGRFEREIARLADIDRRTRPRAVEIAGKNTRSYNTYIRLVTYHRLLP